MHHQRGWAVFVFGAIGIATAGCSRARPGVSYDERPWELRRRPGVVIETEHCLIHSTVTDAVFCRAAATLAERLHEELQRDLGFEPKGKTLCYVFADRPDWEAFTRRLTNTPPDQPLQIRAEGYTTRDRCVVRYTRRLATLTVLAHELVHAYLAGASDRPVPVWLSEGLATLYEAQDWPDDEPRFTPEKNLFRRDALARALANRTLYPLEELLSIRSEDVYRESHVRVRTYYAQIWALVQFLRSDPKQNPYHAGYQRLLAELGTERPAQRASAWQVGRAEDAEFGEAVFRAYIAEDLPEFEEAFTSFAARLAGLADAQPGD